MWSILMTSHWCETFMCLRGMVLELLCQEWPLKRSDNQTVIRDPSMPFLLRMRDSHLHLRGQKMRDRNEPKMWIVAQGIEFGIIQLGFLLRIIASRAHACKWRARTDQAIHCGSSDQDSMTYSCFGYDWPQQQQAKMRSVRAIKLLCSRWHPEWSSGRQSASIIVPAVRGCANVES